jgi:hypothetical protein
MKDLNIVNDNIIDPVLAGLLDGNSELTKLGREILQCDGDLGGDNALDKAMRQLKVSSLIKEHGLLNSDDFNQADERQREAVANVIRAWDNAGGKGYAEYPAVEDAVWEAPALEESGVEAA